MATTAHPTLTVPGYTIETLERLRASLPDDGGPYERLDCRDAPPVRSPEGR